MGDLIKIVLFLFFCSSAFARPEVFTDLIQFSTPAPNQGETNSCLFVGSTGSMEILLNMKYYPERHDLAEQYIMWYSGNGFSWLDSVVLGFRGEYILNQDLPYYAYNNDGSIHNVWSYPRNFKTLPRQKFDGKIKSTKLFHKGKNKWSTYVLTNSDVEKVKEALWSRKSPVLINYNDEGFWHVINIIGYDDTIEGVCYDYTPQAECNKNKGAFYVRDHFGVDVEIRDTDWFRVKANAAYVIEWAE